MTTTLVTGIKPGDTKVSSQIYYNARVLSNVTFDGRSVLVVLVPQGFHVYYSPFQAFAL